MTLSKKLWRFWEGLNSGKINWKFIYEYKVPSIDKDKAVDFLVNRGFVIAMKKGDFSNRGRGHLEVVDSSGVSMNLCYNNKTFFFRSEKYAGEYIDYLYTSKKADGGLKIRKF